MKRSITVLALMAASLLSAACSSLNDTASPSDASFGETVRLSRAAQVIDPQAARKPDQGGIDGRAARAAIELYHDSFKAPQRSFEVLGIGSAARAGQ